MLYKINKIFNLLLSICVINIAAEAQTSMKETTEDRIKGALINFATDNEGFVKSRTEADFSSYQHSQTPRTTFVSCCDSRVHASKIADNTPFNDLFLINTIGNTLFGKGSITYGVEHLNTPLLLIVGHTNCGAVTAATKGYEALEDSVKKELDLVKVWKKVSDPTDWDVLQNVVYNVHHQVLRAKRLFKDKVVNNALKVVGAVYDFQNLFGFGYGALVFINYHGLKKEQQLKDSFAGIENINIFDTTSWFVKDKTVDNTIKNTASDIKTDSGIAAATVM